MSLRNHNWRDVIKVLQKHGFWVERQRGSHIQLNNREGRLVTIPRIDPIPLSTLKSILDQAGLTKEQFLAEL